MTSDRFVLDASVGAKWFLEETGSEAALRLLERCAGGESEMFVPVHFVHEVLSVVRRDLGAEEVLPAWENMKDADLHVVPLTDEVVAAAARHCGILGCTFYDALAPALAELLGGTLVSADARAHKRVPGVELIG